MEKLKEEFEKRFGEQPQQVFFCPGRVNLIGEHIDYNGGRVLPCAISKGTWLAVSKNRDKIFRFQSLNFSDAVELHLQQSYSKTGKAWYKYPLGIINELLQKEFSLSGLHLLFYGNLPVGAGLSSSASIEIVTAFALNELFGLKLNKLDIVLLSKKTENEFIGVNCGIMDQFAVAFAEKNKAILLNCDTLEYEQIHFGLDDYELVIINTNKPRTLADSKYNERFTECGRALKALKKELTVNNLCEIQIETFQQKKHLIGDEILAKRALHVIAENFRVEEAVKHLQNRDLKKFGELMFSSHDSLRYLYEVSGAELDTIVEFSKNFDGCIGARMTGAGFGGCAIALVKKERVDEFRRALSSFYQKKIGYLPEIFSSTAENGVGEVS
ncbi:MAG: galactokinase [Chitinophagaceae bacterium]